MQNSDLFALSDSFLNQFLYTEVETGHNGTPLTILSVLAQLGKDPWSEAETWLHMPQAKAADCLVRDLLEMQIYSNRSCEARAAAFDAIRLLRTSRRNMWTSGGCRSAKTSVALIFCAFALALGFNIFLMTKIPAEVFASNPNYTIGW